MPRPTSSVEGEWVYQPLDGTAPYRITIRATQGGFYEYEAWREGESHPVFQLDRAEGGVLYRGEVGQEFDACIPSGARFSLYPTAESLLFEPSLPVVAPVPPALPGPCTSASRYVLTAKGHGEVVKLHPASDLPGAASSAESRTEAPDGLRAPALRSNSEEQGPAASVTLGLTSAPDGTRVQLLGSTRDATQCLWHRVRLLEPLPAKEEAPHPERKGRTAPPGAAAGHAGNSDAAASAKTARPAEPPSGYVPAESLVVRWQCRLGRAPLREADPRMPGGP